MSISADGKRGGSRRSTGRRASRFTDLCARWGFMTPAALLLFATLAFPVGYTVYISFAEINLGTFTPDEWVGWDNYLTALEDDRFWDSLSVTGIYLVFALPLQMFLGFAIAFLINASWKGRGIVRAAFIIPMVVAPVIAGGIWRMLLDPLWGIANYVIGTVGLGPIDWLGDPYWAMTTVILIDTWRWTPFVTLIASAALLTLPRDVFEAAEIDGANWWTMLWRITLPLLVPMIAATFVVRWLGAVKMFDIALAATHGGPGRATTVVNLFIYEEAFRSLKFAESAAMSLIILVVTMVLTGIFLRGTKMLEERH
ncbi:MAG: sugar ABC transporter permease [Alphaproteobacteria bacterium]|nr:sugar ABC transporter permease [Alphaproteobacteria bacterium]